MSRRRRRAATAGTFALLAGAVCLWLLANRAIQAVAPPSPPAAGALPPKPGPDDGRNIVRQGFPARDADPSDLTKSDTGWEIEWDITNPTNKPNSSRPPASVLRIVVAKFMYKDKDNKVRWIIVLRNLELGEMFVPYDLGNPRYHDVSEHNFWIMKADARLLGPACVAPGQVLSSSDLTMDKKVYKEVHDDGVRWLNDGGQRGTDKGRRGEKMTLWAVFYGGNYRYIIEYGFSDDGIITSRVGATARNHSPRRPDEGDVHLHVGCWMFDPELSDPADSNMGGADRNEISMVRRLPRSQLLTNGLFRIDVSPFGGAAGGKGPAIEGSAQWVPEEFTALRIQSTARKNGNTPPHPTSYDLIPIRYGSVRHFPAGKYEYINKDFWVTHRPTAPPRYSQVPNYVGKPPRTLSGKPVTVWHNSPLLHVPRAEDFGPDGRNNGGGVALTTWASFVLRPRNLFDRTPLFAP